MSTLDSLKQMIALNVGTMNASVKLIEQTTLAHRIAPDGMKDEAIRMLNESSRQLRALADVFDQYARALEETKKGTPTS